ncbi:MAG TPA: hypothetical protein DEA64_02945 [Pseudothermotoga sp.]|nr:hypothetical protein [Pseudothermotoga sp.]
MPNISEISRRVNLPCSTRWKYLKILSKRGFITITRSSHGTVITNEDFQIFQEFVRLVREEGLAIEGALERIGQNRLGGREPIIQYLRRLEKKIEDLEKENRALRDLVQKYLYELEKLKGLPKPKETLLEKIRRWFRVKRTNE